MSSEPDQETETEAEAKAEAKPKSKFRLFGRGSRPKAQPTPAPAGVQAQTQTQASPPQPAKKGRGGGGGGGGGLGLGLGLGGLGRRFGSAIRGPQQRPKLISFEVATLPTAVVGRPISEYAVGDAKVIISDAGVRHYYTVLEPPLSDRERELYSELMSALYYSYTPEQGALDQWIWRAAEVLGILEEVQAAYPRMRYYLNRDALGYGVVDVPMRDDDVEEVSCEGPGKPVAVVHRNFPQLDWLDTNIAFQAEDVLGRTVQRLAMKAEKAISTARPYLDATLPDGSRLAATFSSEISLPGSTFTIRKFPRDPFTAAHLIQGKTLSPLLAAYYWLLLEAKGFVFVIGPTASGKTTVLNTLLGLLNPNLKIATAEETPEINIPHVHWERLRTRMGFTAEESAADIDIFALAKLTLRIRPDYVIVGEARGTEIQSLFQAAATGHGALSTFHGDSVEAAIARMTSPPLDVGKAQLMLVWSFLHVQRLRLESGAVVRRAIASKEVDPFTGELVEVFRRDPRDDTIRPCRGSGSASVKDRDSADCSSDPGDAGAVVRQSVRLKALENLWGWDEDRLREELEVRASFLEDQAKKGAHIAELSAAVAEFYRKRYYAGGRH